MLCHALPRCLSAAELDPNAEMTQPVANASRNRSTSSASEIFWASSNRFQPKNWTKCQVYKFFRIPQVQACTAQKSLFEGHARSRRNSWEPRCTWTTYPKLEANLGISAHMWAYHGISRALGGAGHMHIASLPATSHSSSATSVLSCREITEFVQILAVSQEFHTHLHAQYRLM